MSHRTTASSIPNSDDREPTPLRELAGPLHSLDANDREADIARLLVHAGTGRPATTFDPDVDRIVCAAFRRVIRAGVADIVLRFSSWAENLGHEFVSVYACALEKHRTIYRPVIRDRGQGLRVDSSYGVPYYGSAMLRVFPSVNLSGGLRSWRVAEESFESFARRSLPMARTTVPAAIRVIDGVADGLEITKGRRTRYDHLLADLRRQAKKSDAYHTTIRKGASISRVLPSGWQ